MGLLNDLRERGIYRGYESFVLRLEPILSAMANRGLPVTEESHARVKTLLEERRAQIELAMQALIPPELMPFHPAKGYKKTPKDMTGMEQRWFAWPGSEHEVTSNTNCVKEARWVRPAPWNPSPKNLIRYMKAKGHSIPTNYKTGRPTTDQLELGRLAKKTKDLLYSVVLEYREVSTVIDNHLKNWAPARDGRVHPTFYYETGTGQLATRRPNVQNAPKHKKKTANLFRGMIYAEEGKTLLEFDYKSFHAQTLAFEAQDPAYLRLAKLDIHSYLTAHLVRHPERDSLLSLDDAILQVRLGDIRRQYPEIRDQKAKRAILGYGFGMGWKKLYMLNQESFDSQGDAKRTIDMLNGLFPIANAWRNTIRLKAHEQGHLISRFGCIRWFWEVMKWQEGKLVSGGDDSEAAVAFLPANDAFCHIKLALLRLEERGLLYRYGLINTIHDSLMFECPNGLVEEAIDMVRGEMVRPSEVLIDPVVAPGGLSVEVGVGRGRSWDKMESV